MNIHTILMNVVNGDTTNTYEQWNLEWQATVPYQ